MKTAILVSDLHFCYEDKKAVDILYQILEELRGTVDEYVDLGDGVNNQTLSKYTCYEKVSYSLYTELLAYKAHMETVRGILGTDTKYAVVQDNHFHLRKKKFLAENPAFKGLIPDLSGEFDIEVPHGKLYFPFGQRRFGCIHGVSINDMFTKVHMNRYAKYDVICGHTHTMQTYVSNSGTNDDEARRSYGLPSMCQRMEYTNGMPTRQMTGFALVTYDEGTDYYNLEYIIVENGVAYFRGKKYVGNID